MLLAIQDSGTDICIDLAQYAETVGADGIQLGPPYHFEHTEGDILQFYKDIDRGIGIGVMIYNTYWRGVHLRPEFLLELADLQTVIACKWSVPSANYDMRRGIVLCKDKINMIDNSLHAEYAHLYGCAGFVSGLDDFWVELDLQLWDALQDHDYVKARDILSRVTHPFYEFRHLVVLRTGGEASVKKPANRLVGRPSGPVRRPCRELTDEEFSQLREMMIGFRVPDMVES